MIKPALMAFAMVLFLATPPAAKAGILAFVGPDATFSGEVQRFVAACDGLTMADPGEVSRQQGYTVDDAINAPFFREVQARLEGSDGDVAEFLMIRETYAHGEVTFCRMDWLDLEAPINVTGVDEIDGIRTRRDKPGRAFSWSVTRGEESLLAQAVRDNENNYIQFYLVRLGAP